MSTIIPVNKWHLGYGSSLAQLPDGTPVVGAGYGGWFSANTEVTPDQLQVIPGGVNDGVYVLNFSVLNFYPKYPGYYTVEVFFGIQELGEASGWGTQVFTPVSLTFPGPQYITGKSLPFGGPGQGTYPLVVKFTVNDGSSNGGWPLYFKNDVTLTFTPQ